TDQVNLIDPQGIEYLSEHVSVSGDGDVLIWFDLRIAMRQQVHRNAATDIRQSGQLVTPEMLVQHYTVDKQRHRAGARLGIADTARRGLDAADGQCGLLIAHGSVLLKCWSCERHICFSLSYIYQEIFEAGAVCLRPFAEHSRVLRRATCGPLR